MGRKELRGRDTWQDYSGANAGAAERSFYEVFIEAFKGSDLSIRANPKEFSKIYVEVKLTHSVRSEIYNPEGGITKHGITPDYAIENKKLNKTLSAYPVDSTSA